MNEIHSKRYQAHLLALLNYLQHAAGEHAAKLGFGFDDLIKKNLAWILSRYHIKVARYPELGDKIEVSTWPSGKQGIFALRDFEMKDEEGHCLLVATTSWILLNLGKKQPARLEDFLPEHLTLDKHALKDDFPSLPLLEKAEREIYLRVLMKDLDLNRHVNNVVYIQWALEAAPEDVLNCKRPIDIEVSYKAEAFYGEEVISRIQRQESERDLVFLHQIVNRKTGAELTRLRTVWG
jgi:acyl-ACP thioesterase